jgi:hypothetical protein
LFRSDESRYFILHFGRIYIPNPLVYFSTLKAYAPAIKENMMSKLKIVTLLAGIFVVWLPALVQAYQIAPNPNPSGSTISVITLDAENLSSFENNGFLQINVGGVLRNSYSGATLNNNSGGMISINSGASLDNMDGATLNNNFGATLNINGGTLYSFYSPSINNILNNNFGATLNNNFGTLRYDNLFNGGTLNNGGFMGSPSTTNNTGTLNNNFGGNFTGNLLTNSGILNNSGSLQSDTLYNGGTLNNSGSVATYDLHNAGTLNNNFGGTLGLGEVAHNSGILNNAGLMSNYILYNSGSLNNTGTLNSQRLSNSGTLNNNGTITGTGTYLQTAGQTNNNGSITQSSIAINGGTLSGTGTITGNVTIGSGASVNPGNSPGTMTINGDFSSGGTLVFEIAGLGAGLYDVLNINGNALFGGGNIQFDFINGFNAAAGNYWDFLFADTISGWDSLGFSFNGLGAGLGWGFSRLGNGGERLWIASNTVSPVPEPETYAMLLAGLALLGFIATRKKYLCV